jgi:hypothetical protein
MKKPTQILIAGEPFEDLLTTLRRMPITGLNGRLAQITFNVGDPEFVTVARAAERYAADLLTAECSLTHEERLELAAQRVIDEVERELRHRRSMQ